MATAVRGADLAAVRGVFNGLALSVSVYACLFVLLAVW